MPHGATKFPTRGMCIYCHAKDVELSDEHIVPFSLGGKHVLLEASCKQCADVTKKFEQDVMRELWGDARASYNAPTRRKSERRRAIILQDPKHAAPDLEITMSDYPAPMVFYQMGRAGLLDGISEDVDRSEEWKLIAVVDGDRLRAFQQKHRAG